MNSSDYIHGLISFIQSGNQGMMFGNNNTNQATQSTQVSIPKDVSTHISQQL